MYNFHSVTEINDSRQRTDDIVFSIASNVHLPCGETDSHNPQPYGDYRRRRTQSMELEMQEALQTERRIQQRYAKEKNHRFSTVQRWVYNVCFVGMLTFVVTVLLVQLGSIATIDKEIADLEMYIPQLKLDIVEINEQILENTDENTISLAARDRLGMERCTEENVIHMTITVTPPPSDEFIYPESYDYSTSYGYAASPYPGY